MEDKTLEILTKMYSEMTEQFKQMNDKLDKKADKTDIVRLENELKPKVEVLFNGNKQHTDILERIENKVSQQEEFILKRVK